ncbi:hypothetical protein BC829DRAFT_417290 [Chytridium lagenaria]|nr:hypothetical protein BC829DRAFT_417290 [Chytridium lagenaria]
MLKNVDSKRKLAAYLAQLSANPPQFFFPSFLGLRHPSTFTVNFIVTCSTLVDIRVWSYALVAPLIISQQKGRKSWLKCLSQQKANDKIIHPEVNDVDDQVNAPVLPVHRPMPAALPPRKSNQIRALARKSLSYQKRQVFTNVCCISLCPLFMVVISAGLGMFVRNLIQSTRPIEDVIYCGNNNSLNSDGFPIFRLGDVNLFGANTTNGKSTNYLLNVALSNYDTIPGAETQNFRQPCVFWFGNDNPQNSVIYERNANLSGFAKLDSTFTSPPNGGWAGAMDKRYFFNITQSSRSNATLEGLQPVPYFIPAGSLENKIGRTTPSDIDLILSNRIRVLLTALSELNKTVLFKRNPTASEITAFNIEAGKITKRMPYGALYLEDFQRDDMKAKLMIQAGSDKRISSSATYPPQGKRQTVYDADGAGVFEGFWGKVVGICDDYAGIEDIPVEKEERILIMMRMNGMKSWAYYLTHYFTFYILFTASTIIFLVAGRLARLEFFTLTQPMVLIILFFLWVMTFLMVLCGVIISIVLERLFAEDIVPPAIFLWPPFAFYRALSVINKSSFNKNLPTYRLSMLKPGDEVYTSLFFLIIGFFVYGLLALYFSAVLPSEFGVRRPWHFPLTAPFAELQRRQRMKANGGYDPESEQFVASKLTLNESELLHEDDDVKAERNRIVSNLYPASSPIIVSGIRKVYGGRRGLGPKVAVKDVTFAADQGVIFGLLGPNGAGKTTLISILTGIYEATSGVAKLAGFDIARDSKEVYKVIGVCPQARLKGVPASQEAASVKNSLESVSLTTLANRTTKGLSGGEKRRLSIAIALVGEPTVVFLDEPTTGLDPEVRRLIWTIIQNAREGKTIVLTTHSMEEAEALCQRVGIMAKGTLRCLGNPLRLKELYGSGFRVFFNSKEEDTERAAKWVESLLPEGWTKVDSFATNTSYEFPNTPGIISDLFNKVEQGKSENGIVDWGVSQTTLEE